MQERSTSPNLLTPFDLSSMRHETSLIYQYLPFPTLNLGAYLTLPTGVQMYSICLAEYKSSDFVYDLYLRTYLLCLSRRGVYGRQMQGWRDAPVVSASWEPYHVPPRPP